MSQPESDHTPSELGNRVIISQPEGQLHVVTAGQAGSPVLLLSGAGNDNSSLSWRRLFPYLAAKHRVFSLDWPKQGGSTPWAGTADHDRLLRCIDAVLDHFHLAEIALVGLSQGGALALAYAIEHPDRVSRLVAIAPAGILTFPPVMHQLLWAIARCRILNRTIPSAMFRSRAVCEWFVRSSLFAGEAAIADFNDIVDEFHADVRVNGCGSSDWQNASISARGMTVDLRPSLPAISCPVLFLQGSKDTAVDPKRTEAAADLVPGAEFQLIPGGGHWVNRQYPDAVNHAIGTFLVQ